MRKLVLAAVLVAVAACAPKEEKPAADSTAMDSSAMMTDTTHMMGDSAAMPADTAMARDTTQM
jgi:hypothetical protein